MTTPAIFLALSNPDRFRIVELLSKRPPIGPGQILWLDNAQSVMQIARIIGKSQSQTSQHLAILRKAGLIVSRHEGTTVWNTVSPNVVWPIEVFK